MKMKSGKRYDGSSLGGWFWVLLVSLLFLVSPSLMAQESLDYSGLEQALDSWDLLVSDLEGLPEGATIEMPVADLMSLAMNSKESVETSIQFLRESEQWKNELQTVSQEVGTLQTTSEEISDQVSTQFAIQTAISSTLLILLVVNLVLP